MESQNNKQSVNKTKTVAWLRVKALFFDYLIILLWIVLVGLFGVLSYFLLGGFPDYLGIFGSFGTQAIFFTVLTLPVGLYLYLTESGVHQSTLGKRKVGIKVVKQNGSKPSRKNILLRTVVKLLPWELAHTFIWQMQYVFYNNGSSADVPMWILLGLSFSTLLPIIYTVMIFVRHDGRGPHDMVAGTKVISSSV